jgi:molybdenum cofactor biosynthesis enzyme MoaA
VIPQSNEIRFEVTTKCNYNCVICPREKLTRKIETMDFQTFRFIFDKINAETNQYDTLTFPGMGEPLLDESLDDKIVHARKRGFTVLLLTNGSMLTVERFKKLQDLGLASIRVSIYGDTPESYGAVHGIKDMKLFQKIKDNLTAIAAIKTHTKLLLTYNVVSNYNESSLETWISYWEDKVDLLEVWRPHNWVDAKDYRALKPEKLKTCSRPWKTPLQVQVDGTVNMCCFDFDGKLLLGDLKKHALREIFESAMFRLIEQCHSSGNYDGSGLICENCDQRNLDKSDVMVYNSKFDIQERVHKVSTTYLDLK